MRDRHRHRSQWNRLDAEAWEEAERFYEDLLGIPRRRAPGFDFESSPCSGTFAEAFDDEAAEALPRKTKLPAGVRLGLWVNDADRIFTTTAVAKTVELLQELHIDEICVKVSGQPKSYSRLDLEPNIERHILAFKNEAARVGASIELSIYAWITAREDRCRELAKELPRLASAVDATAIEYDVEAPWYKASPRPTNKTHEDLAQTHLIDAAKQELVKLMAVDAAELGINFVPNGLGATTGTALMEGADYYVPQMYSELSYEKLIKPYEDAVKAGDTALAATLLAQIDLRKIGRGQGPYEYPMALWESFRTRFPALPIQRGAPDAKPVIVGLANYGRGNWDRPYINPGKSTRDVMALDMAVVHELHPQFNITGVRYWASSWLKRSKQAVAFMKALK